MGAEPYWYYTKYQTDLNAALQGLRQQEFNAGRYNPAIRLLDFPITDESPSLGAQHLSIEDALMASEADGTLQFLILCAFLIHPAHYQEMSLRQHY
jgi:hypothetical protein